MLKLIRPLLACVLLAACTLPRGAPIQSEFLSGNQDEDPGFAVYPVTRATLGTINHWPATNNTRSFGWLSHQHSSAEIRIRPFDKLDLIVWDSEENSLLTAPGQKLVDVSNLRVNENGQVFVPYLGYLRVADKTPDGARSQIEREMLSIVPSAQVQLTVTPGTRGSVSLIGGVKTPGSVPLPEGHFTVLNLLSFGGGPESLRNPQVRLVRNGNTYGTSLQTLIDNPSQDAILQGGDKVALVEDERYFRAFGATGTEDVIYFEDDRITALDALTLMGGVDDRRANPQGVLVLREYPGSAVRSDGSGPGDIRSVFAIDLTNADGMFSAGRFPIYSGDTVLATESPLNAASTVLGVVGTVTGLTNRFPQ